MVTVGFVVEGASEKRLVENELFRKWLREDCNLEVVDPVVDAAGNGNMCSRNIEPFVNNLRTIANPNKVVVLADLDPDTCAPCVQKRKEIIGRQGIDLVVIAKKAMESWFLADTKAMRQWLGDDTFYETHPETLAENALGSAEGTPHPKGQRAGGNQALFCQKNYSRSRI